MGSGPSFVGLEKSVSCAGTPHIALCYLGSNENTKAWSKCYGITSQSPVVVAKEIQTLDYLSKGRLLLGVAAGWYTKEFDAVGADFSKRGKTTEEYLQIIRKLVNDQDTTGVFGVRNFVHTTLGADGPLFLLRSLWEDTKF